MPVSMICQLKNQKENYKIIIMERNLKNVAESDSVSQPGAEPVKPMENVEKEEVVIYDECGDTMWDKVLAQKDLVSALKPEEEKEKG